MRNIFILTLIAILLVGSVSAFNFDNKKIFDSKEQLVTIKNTFLGLETSEVAQIKLLSEPDKVCWNTDCFAEFELNINEEDTLITNLEFYGKPSRYSSDLFNLDKNPNYEWKILTNGNFETFDETSKLKTGQYTVRLYVDVPIGKTIEFIPEFYGVRINEWTSFTSAVRVEWYTPSSLANNSQGTSTTAEWIGQGFRVNQTMTLRGIQLRMYTDEQDGNWTTVGIYNATDTGTATTPIVITNPAQPEAINHTVNKTQISLTPYFREFNVTLPQITLYPNRNYSLAVNLNTSGATVQVEHKTSSTYPNGQQGKSTDGGATFGSSTNAVWFEIWGVPANFNNNSVNLISPVNGFSSTSNSFNFNATSTAFFGANLTNATLQIWNSSNALINSTFKTVSGTVLNESIFNVNLSQIDSYKWNILFCSKNITTAGTICDTANSNYSFTYGTMNISSVYDTQVYETDRIFFEENFSILTGYNVTSANLIWNNTIYSGAFTQIDGNNYSINRSIDVPLLNATIPFSWNITLNNSINLNLGSHNQGVNAINLSICSSAPQNVLVANYTFKDEVSLAFINSTITGLTANYSLGNGNINKTLTYTASSDIPSYAFCLTPSPRNITNGISFRYSATNYPQRSYAPSQLIWNSSNPYLQTLYLLGAADGLYVTFQVVNPAQTAISDVSVNVTQGGLLISQGTTDAAGLVTFWVNPNNQHVFTFSKSGFEDIIYTAFPTQSSYTIVMGETAGEQVTDYTKGVVIDIKPPATQTLYNQTLYNFNMTISSSFWDIEEYGFNLTLNNGTQVGFVNSSTVGTVGLNLNTVNYSQINMKYYYIVNSTQVNYGTSWKVLRSGYGGFSIFNFFAELGVIIDSELFGLDSFGVNLFVYLVLFMTVGVFSYKYGASSPLVLSVIVLIIVYFFDVTSNLLPQTIDVFGKVSIPHFFTFLAGLIVAIMVIKEVQT